MNKTTSVFARTLTLASSMCLIGGVGSFIIQSQDNVKLTSCSYLDPLLIDFIALPVGAFLFIEGLIKICKYKESPVSGQVTRCIRMAVGISILVIHTLQFIHK